MKMIWGAAMAAMALAASPLAAQETADVATADAERNETLKLYYTSMSCSQSASVISVFDQNLDEAAEKALNDEAAFWLVLAGLLGEQVGRDANKEFVDESQRVIATMDLLGDAATVEHFRQMRAPCNGIYVELQKDK